MSAFERTLQLLYLVSYRKEYRSTEEVWTKSVFS